MSHLSVGDVFPEFTYDTPYAPQSSFYQLLEEDERPLFLIFLRNFGHPLTRHYIIEYAQSFASLLGARLACVVRTKPQVIAQNLPEGTLPFTVICDAEGALYDFAQVQSSTKRFTCYSLAGMRILKKARQEGYEQQKSEPQQLPLTLLLEAGGKVLLAHYGTSITDQPEDCEAMQLVVEARRKELRRQEGRSKGTEEKKKGKKSKKAAQSEEEPEVFQPQGLEAAPPEPEWAQGPEGAMEPGPLSAPEPVTVPGPEEQPEEPQGPEWSWEDGLDGGELPETLDFVPMNLEIPGFSKKEQPQEDTPAEHAAKPGQDASQEVDAESEALRKYREIAQALFSGSPEE